MRAKALVGLSCGAVFGFVLSWARITDPNVIESMLRLREAHVFLIMASAIVVAAIGTRVLRAVGMRAWIGGEPIAWSTVRPAPRHVIGSVIFGVGWSVARTCPGPVAAMIGQGRVGGLFVVAGLVAGIIAHRAFAPHVVSRGASTASARDACV